MVRQHRKENKIPNIFTEKIKSFMTEPFDISQFKIIDPTAEGVIDPTPETEIGLDTPPAPPSEPSAPELPVTPDFDSMFKERVGGKYEKLDDMLAAYSAHESKAKLLEDPFLGNLVEKYHKGEDLTPYIAAKAVNYDTMVPEDVAEIFIRQKYPNADAKMLTALYQKEIVEGFGLEEEDNAIGRFKFETEMAKVKETLKADQQKYLVPEPGERQSPTREQEEALRQQLETFHKMIDTDPAVRSLVTDKKIAVKYGEEVVNVGVGDPGELVEVTKNTDDFFRKFFVTSDGKPDIQKFLKIAAYAKDPAAYEATLIAFGKTKGTTAVIDQLQNPATIEPTRVGDAGLPSTMVEGFKKAIGL